MTMMLSPRKSASSMLCVVSTITRSFFRLLIVSHTRRLLNGSSPVVGSMITQKDGKIQQ